MTKNALIKYVQRQMKSGAISKAVGEVLLQIISSVSFSSTVIQAIKTITSGNSALEVDSSDPENVKLTIVNPQESINLTIKGNIVTIDGNTVNINQVRPDWIEMRESALTYIRNKPIGFFISNLSSESTNSNFTITANLSSFDKSSNKDIDISLPIASETSAGILTAESFQLLKTASDNIVQKNKIPNPLGLYKIKTDEQGIITEMSSVRKADIEALGIPSTDTTYSIATNSTDGLLSKELFHKIDTLPNLTIDQTVTQESVNLVTSRAVYNKIYEVVRSIQPDINEGNSTGAVQYRHLTNIAHTYTNIHPVIAFSMNNNAMLKGVGYLKVSAMVFDLAEENPRYEEFIIFFDGVNGYVNIVSGNIPSLCGIITLNSAQINDFLNITEGYNNLFILTFPTSRQIKRFLINDLWLELNKSNNISTDLEYFSILPVELSTTQINTVSNLINAGGSSVLKCQIIE